MYIFAAGGTGGHIIPAIAVAAALRKLDPSVKILFIGAGSPLEKRLVEPEFELETIEFVPVLGKGVRGVLRMLLNTPKALVKAYALYRKHQPKAIIAFGGYPSFIPYLAATLLGIPRMLHEQNIKVGLANKVLGLLSSNIYAVPGAKKFLFRSPKAFISNPIRPQFFEMESYRPPQGAEPFKLLIMGGSQGAASVNSAILSIAAELEEQGIEIHHVAGETKYQEVEAAYQSSNIYSATVYGFVNTPWSLIESAHLVVSRAGAMSATEFCVCARPVIYIPLTIAAAHQSENISQQVKQGAAIEIVQNDTFAATLKEELLLLRNDPSSLVALTKNMKKLQSATAEDSATFLAQKLQSL